MNEPERYFFLRFQKTGGTALTLGLRRQFGEDAVYPTSRDLGHAESVLWMGHLTKEFREHRDELRVISGHFPLCAIEVLDAPFRTFTILREPVERTLSLLRRRAQRGAEHLRGRPLEAIYEDEEIRAIATNHMVKMTSMTAEEMGDFPLTQPLELDPTRLARAKDLLDELDVVGLQEDYEGFCLALERSFGWDLGPREVANRTEPQPIDPALRRRIEADNALDLELYEHARALVAERRRPGVARRVAAPKVVITGTGRAGTTLLVQVLDHLGLDTGMAEGRLSPYGPAVRAGLESRVDDPDAPTVVKDMTLGFRLRELLESGQVDIGHVIIPDRRLDVAAASRIRAADYGRRPFGRGSLTGTMLATEQAKVLAELRREIVSVLEDFGIPYTILEFPRFATDAAYTHDALAPVLGGATLAAVESALQYCVRTDMIHEQPLTRMERWQMRLTTAWMVLYRFPIARVRQRIDPERQQAKLRASVAAAREREAELIERERAAGRFPTPSREAGPPPS